MTQLYIFGPFNSGSNLISKIIDNCQCTNALTSMPIINKTVNDDTMLNIHSFTWKHTIKSQELQKIINNKNNIIIFMYKNVYNWISSIQKAPYNITFKTIDKTEILNNNIVLKNPKYNYNHTFGNIIHLYNFYYSNYMSLLIKNPDNVIFLDYYKVINKDTSFNYIKNKLKNVFLSISDEPKFLNILNSPGKTHNNCVKNSQEAMDKYLHTNNRIKTHLLNKTKIHKYINKDIINYFETTDI